MTPEPGRGPGAIGDTVGGAAPAPEPPPNPTPTSVIIVSRHRPAALSRCLIALAQSDHPCFEVIVVADPATLDMLAGGRFHRLIKTAACPEANISRARNIGLGRAAAPVVAFIDDDAVPEPTWLSRLTAPFADARVAAAGGFVRGRDGLSYQWKARTIDRDAVETPLAVTETGPSLHLPPPGQAIKTEGTCCAFRMTDLADIGGFDENYAFYLDEADVNMRLARTGRMTAIVPGAEVHHGFAASERRTAARVPLSLWDIGASMAVFLRRHGGDTEGALERLRRDQRARLVRLMVAGGLVPGDVGRLMNTLEAGLADGLSRALRPLPPLAPAPDGFRPLPDTGPRAHDVFAGRFWQGAALARAARGAVAAGRIATVIRLSPTARPHRVRFAPDGYWEQAGGLFAAPDRAGPGRRPSRFSAFSKRIERELARISACRPCGEPPIPPRTGANPPRDPPGTG